MMKPVGNGAYDAIELRELPPPEHPDRAALADSIDGYIVGEPFAAKAEVDGFGRVLYHTKDIWPDFISCVLVVRQDLIRRTTARSSRSSSTESPSPESGSTRIMAHRMDAAEVTAKHYYFQPPELLKYVLSASLPIG